MAESVPGEVAGVMSVTARGSMTASIPVNIIEGWLNGLQSILEAEIHEIKPQTDFKINLGMRHGLDQIRSRLTTWCRHQKYLQTLNRSGRKFLMVRRVNLSGGRYRKLEWYEGAQFIVLAWLHAKDAPTGELLLEIQEVRDLSKTYLVYTGSSSFDEMVGLARESGMEAVRNEGNRLEWMEKTWISAGCDR